VDSVPDDDECLSPWAGGLIRALYDIGDRLKTWEAERGLDGAAAFERECEAPDAAYAESGAGVARTGVAAWGCPAAPTGSEEDAPDAAWRARIAELRAGRNAGATGAARWAGEAAPLDAELSAATRRLESAEQALAVAQQRIEAIETNTTWRATARGTSQDIGATGLTPSGEQHSAPRNWSE
jgi:hypothetical protein